MLVVLGVQEWIKDTTAYCLLHDVKVIFLKIITIEILPF